MLRFFAFIRYIGSLYALVTQIHSHAFELENSISQEHILQDSKNIKYSSSCSYSDDDSDPFLSMEMLEALLNEIKNGKEQDFTYEEFFNAKEKLRTKLEVLISKESFSDNVSLVSHDTDQSLNETKNAAYRFFLETSLKLLHNISLNDVYEYASLEKEPQMDPSFSQVKVSLREQISSAQTLQDISEEDPFLELPIDDNEKKIISSIILTMAEKNVIKLGLMRRTLEKKGKRIHHVHPLRFLGYIFSTPHLRTSMNKIKRSSFKWDGFIDGLSKKMRDEAIDNNLGRFVPGFSRFLNIESEQVMKYIYRQDWEGLVRFLL
ncbi:MAG TPA: hypothetical protein VLG49_08085 [Rhabdochlamydiaceae bacterium]|nr:hypothetical protein [Rhabdochlamydiaceae bacterium]